MDQRVSTFLDNNHARVLRLGGIGLTDLPGSIFATPEVNERLEVLIVANNFLSSLPEELGLCKKLIRINCDDNLLASLPASLGQCTSLERLFCSNNRLAQIPAALGQCTMLQSLSCYNNLITDFPVELGKCEIFCALECANNPLSKNALCASDLLQWQWKLENPEWKGSFFADVESE